MKLSGIFSFVLPAIFWRMNDETAPAEGNDGVLNVMKMKAIEQSVQTPVELFWKDLWDLAFHRQGQRLWKKIGFKVGRIGKYKACREIATIIMWELRNALFSKNENYNAKVWDNIEIEFEKYLREWWIQNPLDPYTSLDVGVWKSLVKLYTAWLEPSLRGSRKLKILQDIILDPDLTVIKSWTDKDHVDIMKSGSSRQGKFNALAVLRRAPIGNENQRKAEKKEETEEKSLTSSNS